jgi:hypothetical protein
MSCAPFVNHLNLPESLRNRSYPFAPLSSFSAPVKMPTSITVLYPNVDDATFDMKYYTDSHMPMVAEEFKEFGFKGAFGSLRVDAPPALISPFLRHCPLPH